MLAVGDVVLLAPGALLVPGEATLIVADLHLGFEATGLPGTVLPRVELVAERVEEALDRADHHMPALTETSSTSSRVRRIVVNGDVKHGAAPLLAQTEAVRAFDARLAARAPIVYVRGNHDTRLELALPHAHIVPHLRVGRYTIAHGHERVDGPAIVGHEHPIVRLRDEVGNRLRYPAILRLGDRWILPALSPWAAGVDPLRDGLHGPSFADGDPADAEAWAVAEGEVLPLGRLRALRRAGLA